MHNEGIVSYSLYNVSVCFECVCVIANDEFIECGENGYFDKAPAIKEKWNENGWQGMSFVIRDADSPHFSNSDCDACGETLAGDRWDGFAID